MECKMCGRERPIKHFPRRVILGTGQVLKVCDECDNQDIKTLAEAVSNQLEVEIDATAYLNVTRRR